MTEAIQAMNLASLASQYYDDRMVIPARTLLRKLRRDKTRENLAHLLRHHREEASPKMRNLGYENPLTTF